MSFNFVTFSSKVFKKLTSEFNTLISLEPLISSFKKLLVLSSSSLTNFLFLICIEENLFWYIEKHIVKNKTNNANI